MFYSVNSYSSMNNRKGIGGLASGMDTDELVKGMTLGTQNKIAQQLAKKQLTSWKQDAYRDVTKNLNDFQNKYFTYSSGKNNILNPNFFENGTIKNESPYVKVSGNLNSAKNIQIRDILELATTASMTTKNSLSSSDITGTKLYDEWFASTVSGQGFNINVDGKDYGVRLPSTFQFEKNGLYDDAKIKEELTKALNEALKTSGLDKKVNASFDSSGKFILEGIADEEGNMPTVAMGENDASVRDSNLFQFLGLDKMNASGNGIKADEKANTVEMIKKTSMKESLSGKTLNFTFNGISKKITFKDSESDQYSTPAKMSDYLNKELEKSFGKNAGGVPNISTEISAKGELKIKSGDKFDVIKVSTSDKDILTANGALGIVNDTMNRVSWNRPIKDLGNSLGKSFGTPDDKGNYKLTINGTDILINENDTLTNMIAKVNDSEAGVIMSYSTTSDTLNLVAKDSGSMGKINIDDSDFSKALFGAKNDATNGYMEVAPGTNAKLEVSFDGGKNFQTIERTSNSVSLDGLTIEILKKADGAELENIKFTVETNTDEFVDKMKAFIEDYNALVKNVSDKFTEKPDRKFSPLTDEQRKEMSEDEVKLWDEKAKAGVLYNDEYMGKLLTELRTGMFSSVDGVDMGLSSIGITTGNYADNGKLIMDAAGEEKFRKALAEDPEAIARLFTNKVGDPYLKSSQIGYNKDDLKKSGIAYKLDVTFNNFAGTTGGAGLLVGMAGKKGEAYGQDTLSKSIRKIDSNLEKLKKTLQAEEARYFRQFSQMEKYINQMNSQSSWLTQQMGSMNGQ